MEMLPTPSTSHVNLNRIYEPAEDSFLLLDTLSSPLETRFLKQRFGGAAGHNGQSACPIVVEVGTGSGIVLAFIAAQAKVIFGREDLITLGTDLNEYACRAAKQTVWQAYEDTNISKHTPPPASLSSMLCADLASPLRLGIADVLIFNPPYVPSPDAPGVGPVNFTAAHMSLADGRELTSSFEHDSHLLSLSYAGGFEGMEVTNKLLEELPSFLCKKRGVAYILLCQQNRPELVIQKVRKWGVEWNVDTVARSGNKAGWEKLVILRIWRT